MPPPRAPPPRPGGGGLASSPILLGVLPQESTLENPRPSSVRRPPPRARGAARGPEPRCREGGPGAARHEEGRRARRAQGGAAQAGGPRLGLAQGGARGGPLLPEAARNGLRRTRLQWDVRHRLVRPGREAARLLPLGPEEVRREGPAPAPRLPPPRAGERPGRRGLEQGEHRARAVPAGRGGSRHLRRRPLHGEGRGVVDARGQEARRVDAQAGPPAVQPGRRPDRARGRARGRRRGAGTSARRCRAPGRCSCR